LTHLDTDPVSSWTSLQLPQIPQPADGISMVTVISCAPTQQLSIGWVQQQVDEWLRVDDVFRVEFLAGVIFATSHGLSSDIPLLAARMKSIFGTSWCASLPVNSTAPELSSGPYVLWNGTMCRAYRLYDDVNETFMVATQPQTKPG
jgi:hypothetical protein